MAESRAHYHHGDLRRVLVERATAAVRAAGADRFSLRSVAREAGVDVAAVYRHFRNKADLLAAVADSACDALAQRMVQEQAGVADSAERLHAIGRAYVAFAVDEPALFRLASGAHSPGGLTMSLRGEDAPGYAAYRILVAGLDALHREGRIRGPVDAAVLPAWAAVHGLAGLVIDSGLRPAEVQAAVRAVVDTVLRGLAQS